MKPKATHTSLNPPALPCREASRKGPTVVTRARLTGRDAERMFKPEAAFAATVDRHLDDGMTRCDAVKAAVAQRPDLQQAIIARANS
ncbi:MAG: hypothetical protein AAGG38_10830 [Planctomycetota bacterium]